MVLTGLDRFFGGFLNFKISKRPRPLCLGPRKDRDHGPVLIRFSPVRSPVFYWSLRPDLETLDGGVTEDGSMMGRVTVDNGNMMTVMGTQQYLK